MSSIYGVCDENQILLQENNGLAKCVPCQQNCTLCYQSLNNQTECVMCNDGYYLDQNKNCSKCFDKCSQCIGPNLNQCSELKKGYYYNNISISIDQCSIEGCQQCNQIAKCFECQDKYYNYLDFKKIDTGVDLDILKNGIQCKKCQSKQVTNCIYCSQKINEQLEDYVQCDLCDLGYGIQENKCVKCGQNCQVCKKNTLECSICDKGYYYSNDNKQCIQNKDKFCYKYNENQECLMCEQHYFLDNDQKCQFCSKKQDYCSLCTTNEDNFECLQCIIGYHINSKMECQQCPLNCTRCNESMCYTCIKNHFWNMNTKKCELCQLDNCEICENENTCKACQQGYYFDQNLKNCQPCKNNCLSCDDYGQKCFSCPISYYLFEKEIIQNKGKKNKIQNDDGNIFGQIFQIFEQIMESENLVSNSSMKVVYECVEKCPNQVEGKHVSIDELEKKCIVTLDKKAPIAQLPKIFKDEKIETSILKLKIKYDQEIKKIIKNSKTLKDINFSETCSYNGNLYEHIDQRQEYYYCRCKDSYVGDNCEISFSLFHNTQTKLMQILKKLEQKFIHNKDYSKNLLLDTLLKMNTFKYSIQLVQKIVQMLQMYTYNENLIDNKKKLYLVYDSLFTNIFDILEDYKKENKLMLYSIDEEYEKNEMKKFLNDLLMMIEKSFEQHKYQHSFLEHKKKNYESIETYSFKIYEFLHEDFFNQMIEVANPKIDTSSKINSRVQIKFIPNNDIKQLHIQIIHYSYQLFEDIIRSKGTQFLTNVLYFKVIENKNQENQILDDFKFSQIEFTFPLIFLPSWINERDHIKCEIFEIDKLPEYQISNELYYNDKTKKVTCIFKDIGDLKRKYFAVTSKQLISIYLFML